MSITSNRLVWAIVVCAVLLGGAFWYFRTKGNSEGSYPYTLPALPYAYDDLEPHIDAATMKLHHTKHHQAYIDKLNKALQDLPIRKKSLEYVLTHLDEIPEALLHTVKNNGGGHFNHSFFWKALTPEGNLEPVGTVKAQIEEQFGSFEKFKEQFSAQAAQLFGSGWVWLTVDSNDKLHIISTANQDTPLAQKMIPLLALDLWEHAYYLKYHHERAEYIAAWWQVVNWEQVEKNYSMSQGTQQRYDDADNDEY